MNLDTLAIALRPRPMLEAADLGARLVQQHARSVWGSWLPVYLVVVALALALSTYGAGWGSLVIFLSKPWLDRTIVFVLARAAFAQSTRFSDVLANWRTVWWRQAWRTWTVDRLTFWRAFTLPVVVLEGQSGAARGARIRQLAKGRRGSAAAVFGGFVHVEAAISIAVVSLVFWFAPPDSSSDLFEWLVSDEGWGGLFGVIAYALAVLIVEPFYAASGFAMYLNRRVELEAWDIEQAFRRAFAPGAA